MAYSTITLRIKELTFDGVKPTSVTVTVYPMATDSTRLKVVKDTAGGTILSGHVLHRATAGEITAGVVDIVLPDPRDNTLSPAGFGYQVQVKTNYFTTPVVVFGPTEITANISGGVLILEDVTPTDIAAFAATTTYVVKPTGGTDGQALVKSGTDVVWGTVAGGGGGGAVASVNAKTGAVVLSASDVGADASGAATAAQSAAISAAATDATTKANAAQAAAVQRANHTGTQSADTLTDGTTNKAYTATERTKLTGVATAATANSPDATLLARANHTGTQSADTLTDGTTNKAFLATERTKLSGVATGATVNSTDAQLRDRSTHTGTQAESTVTNLVSDLAAKMALQQVAASVTADGATVVNKHNPVDATSGVRAITLPTGQTEGTQVSIEKTDASANVVNITGNIRGVAATTIPLSYLSESLMLRADSAGSWWPIAGHRTKASLDATYGPTVTQTLTNKRVTRRVDTTTSAATYTFSWDNFDAAKITAQAAALTLANPSGTPTAMQPVIFRIKDNGTAQTIGYGTQFRAIGVTLPTTTVVGKTLYLGGMWNSEDSKLDVVAVGQEA